MLIMPMAVFQPLNILGMVIYGTELVLWIGVFICGGYFNYTPWVRERIRARRSRPGEEVEDEMEMGTRNNVAEGQLTIHRMPSSRSVFRTPSREEEEGAGSR